MVMPQRQRQGILQSKEMTLSRNLKRGYSGHAGAGHPAKISINSRTIVLAVIENGD
jgi:hypothetical protein